MAQRKRYDADANVIMTRVGCTDLAFESTRFSTADLRALASLARALAARAEEEISARRPSFPSSLPPQLVLAWLPLREVGPALRASTAWRGAAEPLFQLLAQSRNLQRERADVPWSEVVRCSKKRAIVVRPGARFPFDLELAERLGVYSTWTSGLMTSGSDERLRAGDAGDVISEVGGPQRYTQRAVAIRADRNGAVHVIGRSGVLVGFPGELGTATLTASKVDALGVAELRKELAARAVQDTTGTEAVLRGRLKSWLRNPPHDGFRRANAIIVPAPAPGLQMQPALGIAPHFDILPSDDDDDDIITPFH